MNPTLVGVIIGAAVALLGSVITGIVSWKVGNDRTQALLITTSNQLETAHRHHREQLQATAETTKQEIHSRVVLAERMKWIGELRDSIAEYHGVLGRIYVVMAGRKDVEAVERGADTLNSAAALASKIQLLLNPDEEDHRALIEHVVNAFGEATKGAKGQAEARKRILAAAQSILKREWKRVKKGE